MTISRIKNFSTFHFQEFIIDNLKGETSMKMVSRFGLSISKLYSSHFYCSNFQDNSDYNNLKGETTNEPNNEDEEVGQEFSLSLSTLLPDRENKPQTCCSSHFHCFNFQDKCDYDNLKGETTNEADGNGEEVGHGEF